MPTASGVTASIEAAAMVLEEQSTTEALARSNGGPIVIVEDKPTAAPSAPVRLGGGSVGDGRWHLVAFSFGSSVRLIVDGVVVGRADSPLPVAGQNATIILGGGGSFGGVLDELVIFAGQRGDLADLYRAADHPA